MAYMSLRRKVFEMAMNGNLGACIWLSKQWLDLVKVASTPPPCCSLVYKVNTAIKDFLFRFTKASNGILNLREHSKSPT